MLVFAPGYRLVYSKEVMANLPSFSDQVPMRVFAKSPYQTNEDDHLNRRELYLSLAFMGPAKNVLCGVETVVLVV